MSRDVTHDVLRKFSDIIMMSQCGNDIIVKSLNSLSATIKQQGLFQKTEKVTEKMVSVLLFLDVYYGSAHMIIHQLHENRKSSLKVFSWSKG